MIKNSITTAITVVAGLMLKQYKTDHWNGYALQISGLIIKNEPVGEREVGD